MNPKANKKPYRCAYTFIEIVMVIVVIGIIAMAALPRIAGFAIIQFSGAMKKITENVRYVQQIAISKHTTCRIVFDDTNDTYSADEESPQGSNAWVAIPDPFTRANLTVNFRTDPYYTGINITGASFGGGTTLHFNWAGIPQNATRVNLTSEGWVNFIYKGNNNTLYVSPNTGRVRVE